MESGRGDDARLAECRPGDSHRDGCGRGRGTVGGPSEGPAAQVGYLPYFPVLWIRIISIRTQIRAHNFSERDPIKNIKLFAGFVPVSNWELNDCGRKQMRLLFKD